MSVRVAINGFGRIGRNILRAIVEAGRKDIEVVAINDLGPVETNAHLLALRLRAWPLPRRGDGQGRHDQLRQRRNQGDRRQRDPAQLPWKELGIDIALECTGIFTSKDKAARASHGRRQARADLGAGRRRRPHRRLWRQPRQADQGAHGRLQRVLHDQLPRAGRQGAQRRRRHRQRLHDDDPFLHRRPADARSRAQGSLSRRAPRR